MKVKIGDIIYDSEDQPILLILTDADKKNISGMVTTAHKYCSYPDTEYWMKNDYKNIKNWMNIKK